MEITERHEWGLLHDLALLYLALVHGADAEIAPSELEVMAAKLKDWRPAARRSDIQRITDEVMLIYVSQSGRQMLEASVVSLQEQLAKVQRVAILNDLAELASADGLLAPGEVSFIQQLARQWGVDQDAA